MNHQSRRLPLRYEVDGIVLGVTCRIEVFRAAVFPFRKPQLLGGVVHAAIVEYAIVSDQALESIRPLTGYPIDHIAAVGSAERAHAIAVQPGILLQGGGQAELEIL